MPEPKWPMPGKTVEVSEADLLAWERELNDVNKKSYVDRSLLEKVLSEEDIENLLSKDVDYQGNVS